MSIVEDVGAGAFLTGACLTSVAFYLKLARSGLRRVEAEHLARERARRAQAAAAEASLQEDWFAPEAICGTVDEILELAEAVWREGHLPSGTRRQDRTYVERWARSIIADAGDGVRLSGRPSVDILGLVNRPGESEDRVVLRVRLKFRAAHHESGAPHARRADMRWTLGRRNHSWALISVDLDPLADGVLTGRLIPTEWADDDRLREASLAELAEHDAGRHPDLSELVARDLPAARQLMELGQLDGRFDPDLLDARIRHLAEAWEAASTGPLSPLSALASPRARNQLVGGRPWSRRLVVRDLVVERWTAAELAVGSAPYRLEITVVASATRFLVRWPSGAYLSGDARERHAMNLRWTLALPDARGAAWQLVASTNPAEDIGGRTTT